MTAEATPADTAEQSPDRPSRLTHSARRINKLHARIGGKHYLEIGVFRGHTFADVSYTHRTAVDPNFKFDTQRYAADPAVTLHEITSDAFFTDPAIAKPTYDCIFLDGLHEFTQTFRDFCATQAYAGPRTVWVIDDVWPVDVFSAWPVQDEAIAFRAELGIHHRSWHGDIYKVVYLIMTFFPSFSYRVVIGNGNPQLFVWRSARRDFAPFAGTLAQIETMSYFELRRAADVFRRADEDAVVEEIARDFGLPPRQDTATAGERGAVQSPVAMQAPSAVRGGDDAAHLSGETLGALETAQPGRVPSLESLTGTAADAELRRPAHETAPPFERITLVGELMEDGAPVLGAQNVMLPQRWKDSKRRSVPLKLLRLEDAYVFNGRVTRRVRDRHDTGQLVLTRRGELTSESFGLAGGKPTLPADLIGGEGLDGPLTLTGDHDFERLDGVSYLIGSVPRQFGGVLLEGLSRLWAFVEHGDALAVDRFLIYEAAIPNFARRLLHLLGVADDRIVTLDRKVQAGTLYVPSPSQRTHRWLRPEHRTMAERIVSAVAPAGPASDVYLSRSQVRRRPLENEADVEALFADAGYSVVRPEALDIREQIALAANARSLAGAVGSQMFLALFQRPGASNIVLAPQNFYTADDGLIAGVMDHRLCTVMGTPVDLRRATEPGGWRVDPDRVRQAIDWRLAHPPG